MKPFLHVLCRLAKHIQLLGELSHDTGISLLSKVGLIMARISALQVYFEVRSDPWSLIHSTYTFLNTPIENANCIREQCSLHGTAIVELVRPGPKILS